MRPLRAIAAILCVLLLSTGLTPAWCAGMRPVEHACCSDAHTMPPMDDAQCPRAVKQSAMRVHIVEWHVTASHCDCVQPERRESAYAPSLAVHHAVLPTTWTFGDPLFRDEPRSGAPPPPLPRSSRRQTSTPLRL